MAQINLSFRELLDITSTLDTYAREIREVSAVDAERASALANELHVRFAKARTAADDAEDREITLELLSRPIHPDAQIPDSIWAPDPEDFSEEVPSHD